MMPDNFSTATLLPDAAMRPSRLAEPLSCVPMEEKVSDCTQRPCLAYWGVNRLRGGWLMGTYGRIDHLVRARIVVDVDGYAAESRNLGRELFQSGIVLALALKGFRHVGGCLLAGDRGWQGDCERV